MAIPNRTDQGHDDEGRAQLAEPTRPARLENEMKEAHDSLMGKPLERHIRELNALFSRNLVPKK
jgi:hypothetical protein